MSPALESEDTASLANDIVQSLVPALVQAIKEANKPIEKCSTEVITNANDTNCSFRSSRNVNVLVMHLNLRFLKKNLDKLEALILGLSSPPSVLCLTETWLSENDDPKCFLLHGYSQYLTNCRTSRGGGVMIQVKNDLSIIEETETS